jgi:arsenate reductase-like glutaredoxin family protein
MSPKATPQKLQVQVFGRRDSRATQKALRFFSERRVEIVLVDLARKPMAPTELRRFAERFGSPALMDRESKVYRDAGLAYLSMDNEAAFERVLADQRLLRLPLIRSGNHLAIGVDESAWRDIVVAPDQRSG